MGKSGGIRDEIDTFFEIRREFVGKEIVLGFCLEKMIKFGKSEGVVP